jgi:hypothetical protein
VSIKYVSFTDIAAASLTVIFLLFGMVSWPVAVVLLLLCCDLRRTFE